MSNMQLFNSISVDEKKLWEETHKNNGYSRKVFSLLDSDKVLVKVKTSITSLFDSESSVRILIPGCGSNPNLQMCCKEVFGERAIIDALDWSQEAIDISKAKTDSLGIQVSYHKQSYYDLTLPTSIYDLVIVSNAIVSQSNDNNVLAVTNLTRLLKQGGHFIGFFPSPFNMLDYALTNPDAREWLMNGTVNVAARTIQEEGFCCQRFFSPLELYGLLKKLNLKVDAFELFFYDEPVFVHQISAIYHLKYKPDCCFWGYFIKTTRG